MSPVQNKKDVFFFLRPGGLGFLQAPSLLGWTPVQPLTSSASVLLRTLLEKVQVVTDSSTGRFWVWPTVLQWILPRSCRFASWLPES